MWKYVALFCLIADVASAQEYSIWLSSSSSEFKEVSTKTEGLCKIFGTPCFAPHVTVVPDLKGTLKEITVIAKSLAKQTRPLQANFTGIEWTPDNFWRSFYLKAEDTPEFHRLYDDTCAIAGKCQTWPYHMSLMYVKPQEVDREILRKALTGRFPKTLVLDLLQVCTSGNMPEKWTCPVAIKLK